MVALSGAAFNVGKVFVSLFLCAINCSQEDPPKTSITKTCDASTYSLRMCTTKLQANYNSETFRWSSNYKLDGLVLARKGSKGIPHKNMVVLNGQPLIYYALNAMIQSGVFQRIWVSTDDPEVSDYILLLNPLHNSSDGINVELKVHKRAWYTATDNATSLVAVQEFLKCHPEVDNIGLVQSTSPFIRPKYLIQAAQLITSKNLDSVFSVTRQRKFRWSEIVNDKELTKPLNFDPKERPRRQDWPGELVENGMFYFVTRETVMAAGLLQGARSLYFEIPKEHSLEIDSYDDLAYADILMNRRDAHADGK